MSNAIIVLNQNVIMFIMMFVGLLLYKTKMIDETGTKQISDILITIVSPCAIVYSFLSTKVSFTLSTFVINFLMCAISILIAMLVSALIFKNDPIAKFSASFSNSGFMGIPLVTALLGTDAVFCIAPFIALTGLGQYTYGQYVLTGNKGNISPGFILKSPNMIALIVGLIGYPFRRFVPGIALSVLNGFGQMNTAIAMLVMGTYLAKVSFKDMFTNTKGYAVAAVRLLLVPAIVLLLFRTLRVFPFAQNDTMKMVFLAVYIPSITPVGANVAIFAQRTGTDYTYACKNVCLASILSLITIPIAVLMF